MDPIRARAASSYAYFLSYRQGARERARSESFPAAAAVAAAAVECPLAEMIPSTGAPPSSVEKHPPAGHDKT